MSDTVTTDAIRLLRDEAGSAGDLAQVEICDRALAGDEQAIEECARVITHAAAQAADES